MDVLRERFWCLLVVASLASGCSTPQTGPVPMGAWLLDGDPMVTTASGDDGIRYRNLSTGESQRLVRMPGAAFSDTTGSWVTGTGWGADPDAPPLEIEVNPGELLLNDGNGVRAAPRIALRELPFTFRNGDVELSGRLLLPQCAGPHPAVIMVHGSERTSAVATYAQPWAFAAAGIASLVFDKRGTGASEGSFTMDFSLLADDVVRAAEALRESGHVDPSRVGLAGYSQGGWVAPIAASRTDVAFLLIAYGMIDSPASEDRAETLDALRRSGFGEEEIAKADDVVLAVHDIIASDFQDGWDELGALKRLHRGERWLGEMGGFSAPFVRYPKWLLTTFGKRQFPPGLPFHHHSADLLPQLDMPMLWLVAGADREAPPRETIAWLEANPRPNIDWTVYAGADHGMLEFIEEEGERTYTRVVPSFYRDQVQWVREVTGASCPSAL